ncbi:MAG: hypothetical protein O7D97_02095, partial [Planctomycetota bacterium]|nr:hypothetical protein [Planctomycetota bacterium]
MPREVAASRRVELNGTGEPGDGRASGRALLALLHLRRRAWPARQERCTMATAEHGATFTSKLRDLASG